MTNENNTVKAPTATDAPEHLLNLIIGRLEIIRAMPEDRIDWSHEAMSLLAEIEQWAVGRHPAGELIFRDPADEITMEAI